jgi:ankyrin repeat protein
MGAACTDHPELVALLLAKGAKLETKNNWGATALMEAAKNPCASAVKLLIVKGADIHAADDHGHTALIFAAYHGRTDNIKLLLAAGADPNAVTTADAGLDGKPYNAAEAASAGRFREAADLILEAQKSSKATATKP